MTAEIGFTELVQLTTHAGEDFALAVSQDGSFMVYLSDRSGNLDLWLKDLRVGPRQPDRRLTFHSAADTAPSLSPDGKRIAFISTRSDAKGDLYLLLGGKANGQERQSTRLMDSASSEIEPAWSSDGEFIFFHQ